MIASLTNSHYFSSSFFSSKFLSFFFLDEKIDGTKEKGEILKCKKKEKRNERERGRESVENNDKIRKMSFDDRNSGDEYTLKLE